MYACGETSDFRYGAVACIQIFCQKKAGQSPNDYSNWVDGWTDRQVNTYTHTLV